MNLYIPEIGDVLVLTEDWTFNLHPESRNLSLAKSLGYYIYNDGFVNETELPAIRNPDYYIVYPTQEELNAKCKRLFSYDHALERKLYAEARDNNPEYVKYQEDYKAWVAEAEKLSIKTLSVTLEKGQVLKVDRIYIRKGAKDYSSVTFYAKSLAPVTYAASNWSKATKKAVRFWAKLSDCNTINFEKHEN